MRKGITGDFNNHFDDKMNKEWDDWIDEQLKGSGFTMQFK